MEKLFSLVMVAAFCIACTNQSRYTDKENVLTEKEIMEFVSRYDDMWARRDTTAMKEAISENYIYFTSTGNTYSRERIISWFIPADKYKVNTAARSEIRITIHGNTAVVGSRWIGSGTFGNERFSDDQRCSLVIKKENDQLRLISEHCTQIVK